MKLILTRVYALYDYIYGRIYGGASGGKHVWDLVQEYPLTILYEADPLKPPGADLLHKA
jgi:hypothetical protein